MVLDATCSCMLEPEAPNLPTKSVSLIYIYIYTSGLRSTLRQVPLPLTLSFLPKYQHQTPWMPPLAPWGSTGRTCIKKPKDSTKTVKATKPFCTRHIPIRAVILLWSHMCQSALGCSVAGPLASSRLAQPNTFRTFTSIIHWPLGIGQPPSQHCRWDTWTLLSCNKANVFPANLFELMLWMLFSSLFRPYNASMHALQCPIHLHCKFVCSLQTSPQSWRGALHSLPCFHHRLALPPCSAPFRRTPLEKGISWVNKTPIKHWSDQKRSNPPAPLGAKGIKRMRHQKRSSKRCSRLQLGTSELMSW